MNNPSIIAANNQAQILGSGMLDLRLNLSQGKRQPALNKISLPAVVGSKNGQLLRHAYLHFEHITGRGAPPVYDVYLNLPPVVQNILKQGAHAAIDAELESQHFAGSLGFYGLELSSTPSLEHDGSGMNITLDVADLLNSLRSSDDWNEQTLHVSLLARAPMTLDAAACIGRISLHVVAA